VRDEYNDHESSIDLSRFAERMNGYTKALDVATGNVFLGPTHTGRKIFAGDGTQQVNSGSNQAIEHGLS
jgi:hypothetical protein